MAAFSDWQSRPLEPMYPVAFFEALTVKIRDDVQMSGKTAHFAFAVLPNGTRDVLGIWMERDDGGKLCSEMFFELRDRGVADILIAVADGRGGLTPAFERAFPKTLVQTDILPLIRDSLSYANAQERSALATALRPVYTAGIFQEIGPYPL